MAPSSLFFFFAFQLDSRLDCQPVVYERCRRDQVRNGDGSCVDGTKADDACNSHCRKTRVAHYDDFRSENPTTLTATQFGVVSRESGYCQCLHDLRYGAEVLSSSSSSGYVDGHGDYVVKDEEGKELDRVSSGGRSGWSRESLSQLYGECPRAVAGGEDCRITHVHTNRKGECYGLF
jgi:hypothetical protein